MSLNGTHVNLSTDLSGGYFPNEQFVNLGMRPSGVVGNEEVSSQNGKDAKCRETTNTIDILSVAVQDAICFISGKEGHDRKNFRRTI